MLALSAVDRIFARLAVRYGSAWTAKWDGLDMQAVKVDWANELDSVSYEAIAYALRFLPAERPPTATAFREQCMRMPPKDSPAIEQAPYTPGEVPPQLAAIGEALTRSEGREPKAWAWALKEREEAGEEHLTRFQRQAWREAVRWVQVEASKREEAGR